MTFFWYSRFLNSVHNSFLNQTTLDLRKEKWSFLNQDLPVLNQHVIWKSFLMISNLSIYGNVFETAVFQKMSLFSLWLFRLSCPSVPLSLLFWTKNSFVCIQGQYKFSIEIIIFFFKRASEYFYRLLIFRSHFFSKNKSKNPSPPNTHTQKKTRQIPLSSTQKKTNENDNLTLTLSCRTKKYTFYYV